MTTGTKRPPVTHNSNEEYHSSAGISSTQVKSFAKLNPQQWYHQYLDPCRPKQTPTKAMQLGTLTHAMVLEPDTISKTFGVLNFSRATKLGKAELADMQAAGLTVVSQEDYDLAAAMTAAIRKHKLANQLLSGGQAEQSFYRTDEETSLTIKARCDYITDTHIIDVKTCIDSDPDVWIKAAASMRYDLQAIHYQQVIEPLPFAFVNVAKSWPHSVSVVELHPDDMSRAATQWRELLNALADHIERDDWPGFDEIARPLMPAWAW